MKKFIIILFLIIPNIVGAIEIKPSIIPRINIIKTNNNQEKITIIIGKNNIELLKIKIPNYEIEKNFLEDDNILKFVNPKYGLTNQQYEPKDLVEVKGKYVKGNTKLRLEAKNHLDKMAEKFYEKFYEKINVVSGYRSFDKQWNINKTRPLCVKNLFCSKPGYSEHQLGLAIDIFGLSQEIFETNQKYSEYYKWIKENAHYFGWTQSYQKGKEIDGYNIEPWHWRYVGIELATILYKENKTLSEYVKEKFTYFQK